MVAALGLSLAMEVDFSRHSAASLPVVQSVAGSQDAASQTLPSASRAPVYSYTVVRTFPHDRQAFTQGLVYEGGFLYESTGLFGSSSLRKVELETGQVLKKIDIESQFFAEGLALFGGRAIQLTWTTQVGFIYDQESFDRIGGFTYSGEGWGLTHDGSSLIMSNGTDEIRFLDPTNFQVRRTIKVTDHGVGIRRLNELEYIEGEIWANIWQTDRIARIEPASGRIAGWVDLTGILPAEDRFPPVDVLNGIAYDPEQKRIFVTGKLWPKLFEIKLRSRRGPISKPQ